MKLFPDTVSIFFPLLFMKKNGKEKEKKICLFVICIGRVLKYSNSALNLYFCICNLRMQA